MRETLTPIEATRNFVENLNFGDLSWIIVSIAWGYMLYKVSSGPRLQPRASKKRVIVWIYVLLGWSFCAYMVMIKFIVDAGFIAWALLGTSLVLAFVVMVLLTNKKKVWEEIFAATILGIIGYGALALFGTGKDGEAMSLIMGSLGGFVLGEIKISSGGLPNDIEGEEEAEEAEQEFDFMNEGDLDSFIAPDKGAIFKKWRRRRRKL